MKIILSFILLLSPTIIEAYRDRNGDAHPNSDWEVRGVFCVISAFFVELMMWNNRISIADNIGHFFIFIFVSVCLFTAIFPYLINYIHLKNGVVETQRKCLVHILGHLSKTAWPDRTNWWRKLGMIGRLAVNIFILLIGFLLFFL